jgi:hypothetical protein
MNRCSISCHSTLNYTVINIFNPSVSPPACLYTSFWFQFLTWSTSPDTGKSSRIYFSIKVLCQHRNTISHVPSNWYEFFFDSSNSTWNLINSRWTTDLLQPLNHLIVWSNIYQTVQCFTTLLQTHTESILSVQKKVEIAHVVYIWILRMKSYIILILKHVFVQYILLKVSPCWTSIW